MSDPVNKAWLTELLKLCHFYRSNAAVRQGLPDVQPLTTVGDVKSQSSPQAGPVNIPALAAKPIGKLATALIALPAMFGSAVLGAVAMSSLQPPPSLPAPVVEIPQDQQNSLLQFLEDEGEHIYGPDRTDSP